MDESEEVETNPTHGHHHIYIPTDPDRETPLMEVSRSVVGKIPFGELAWAVMKHMERDAIRNQWHTWMIEVFVCMSVLTTVVMAMDRTAMLVCMLSRVSACAEIVDERYTHSLVGVIIKSSRNCPFQP